MTTQLAPCPFCGFEPQQNSLGIQCSSVTCHSTQTFTIAQEEAIERLRRLYDNAAEIRDVE